MDQGYDTDGAPRRAQKSGAFLLEDAGYGTDDFDKVAVPRSIAGTMRPDYRSMKKLRTHDSPTLRTPTSGPTINFNKKYRSRGGGHTY